MCGPFLKQAIDMKRFSSLVLVVGLLGCGSERTPEAVTKDIESQSAPADTSTIPDTATVENDAQQATDDVGASREAETITEESAAELHEDVPSASTVESAGVESAPATAVQEEFLASGVTRRVGGYRPIQAEMDADPELVATAPDGLQAPKYGQISIGEQSWLFILDEPAGEPAKLYIDTNGDGDLTNDPEPEWNSRESGELTSWSGSGQIALSEDQIGSLGMYRFDPADERRAALSNTFLYYVDYGYSYTFSLDDEEFSTFVAGSPTVGASLPINRDENPRVSRRYEMAKIGEPFNFTGTTYVFSLEGGRLLLDTSDTELPVMPLPPDLRVGQPAPQFTATLLSGESVVFPDDFTGSIVMLDCWATWCGPCIREIPNVKQAYADWHDEGFEILGVSFDSEGQEEKVKDFLDEYELSWAQVFEGAGWENSVAELYDVSGIPFVLLVDGDTGRIIATERNLRGAGVSEFIGTQIETRTVEETAGGE